MYVSAALELTFYLLLVFQSFLASGQSNVEEPWSPELVEMKVMLTALTSKMSAFDKKLSELNFLEYAFKVNNLDNHLAVIKQSIANLDTRLGKLEAQTDDIKEILLGRPNLRTTQRPAEIYKRTTPRPVHSVRVGGGEDVSCRDLNDKIEDFSYKIVKSQQDIKEDSKKSQQSLNTLLDTVRNGFTKNFQKVDALLNIEGPLTQLSSKLSGVPRALERLGAMSEQFSRMQSNTTLATEARVNELQRSNDRILSSLNYAVDLGGKVKTDLRELSNIESDIMAASKMSKFLLTGKDPRRPITEGTLKNLSSVIEKAESILRPLLVSLPYNFDGIYGLLEASLQTTQNNNKGSCNFHDIFKYELTKIETSLENQQCSHSTAVSTASNEPTENSASEHSVPTKQQEVFDNLGYVRSAMALIRSDLLKLFKNCPDGSVSTVRPIGMVVG